MARRTVLVGTITPAKGYSAKWDKMIEQIIVVTPACMVCGKIGQVKMPEICFNKWQAGSFIQDAWPNGPAGLREQLINGTHSECWDLLFKHEEGEWSE